MRDHPFCMVIAPARRYSQGCRARRSVALALAAILIGAASPSLAQSSAAPVAVASNGDPFEPMNRRLYAFNGLLDRVLLRPVAMLYRRILPKPIRQGVHNVLGNLDEPIVFANDLLQLRLRPAGRTAVRFGANTTFGILGLFDVAARAGLTHHDNSFGDTLGRAGVRPGPYLFLPGLGPTTLRDMIGGGADLYIDPINHLRGVNARAIEAAQVFGSALDERVAAEPDLKNLSSSATDPYATLRSVYLQTTAARVAGGEVSLETLADLPGDSTAPPPASEKPGAETPAEKPGVEKPGVEKPASEKPLALPPADVSPQPPA